MVLFNYLEPKLNIGHYCLIRRSNKQEAINEIRFNFQKL